jgi:hypothetical protein
VGSQQHSLALDRSSYSRRAGKKSTGKTKYFYFKSIFSIHRAAWRKNHGVFGVEAPAFTAGVSNGSSSGVAL